MPGSTPSDCDGLLRAVWWIDFYLEGRCKVVVHCGHGLHRTGMAIYLLLRSILPTSAQCLSVMQQMRPEMYDEIVLWTYKRHLVTKADTIFASSIFQDGIHYLRPWR